MKKTVLITGASSGFGKAAVELFHEKGWNVVATLRTPEAATSFSSLSNVLVTRLDVTDKESIKAAVATAIKQFGHIDVLVNNAGFGAAGALEAATDQDIRQQFDVNLFGLIDVTKAVLPAMRARKEGTIINISSIGGRFTFPFSSLYHATKFAVEGLTESLQYELNPLGIRLKLVEPGGYKTDFAGRSMNYYGTGNVEGYQEPFTRFISKVDEWPMSENTYEVAEVIYQAATDGTEQLRYPVGQDAIELFKVRSQMDDASFKAMMAGYVGLNLA
ncbi:SDR family oxidoreductase [Chitinophaga tropicalis]|uniref:SDR family NAD(P)-dependent oxidoreductase n=1 Tax=Chitinophaga tropicalis TaxID=2683588 RepID=A0A7K1U6U9_9BACT|nr:SDR family oxidoreductase [Chitinophaga tropicalis]MVT10016.1 SDR family NAD(P)-dependent oxidoreductase [Chitinophaga tropicalis]